MIFLYCFILKDVLITSPLIVSVPSFWNWQPAIPQKVVGTTTSFAFVPVLLIAIGRSIYRCQDGLNFPMVCFNFSQEYHISILGLEILPDLESRGFNANYTMEDRWFDCRWKNVWFPVIQFCSIYIYVILRKVDLKKNYGIWCLWSGCWQMSCWLFFYRNIFIAPFAAWAAIFVSVLAYWSGNEGWNDLLYPVICSYLIPMVIFTGFADGMMTGQAVVMYNPSEFSNFRLVSIPVEDFFSATLFCWQSRCSILI